MKARAQDRRLRAAYPLPRPLLLELFATANLAFLAADVALAHTANAFRDPTEWIPVAASLLGTVALAVGLLAFRPIHTGAGRWIGLAVGSSAVAVGVAGMLLHLQSAFFQELTLRSLVYSAPFVAPLAYAALGLILLLNRMVPAESAEWGLWLLFLTLGGLVGNFALSLADHAQNGFFNPLEWVPVVVAAIGVAFFTVAMARPPGRPFLLALIGVLLLQATTGLVGFGLHLRHLFDPTVAGLGDRVLYGAPPFAPLLFADLALLGGLAVWDLHHKGSFGAEPAAERAAD